MVFNIIFATSSVFGKLGITRFEVWHFSIVFDDKIGIGLIKCILDDVILLILNIDVLFILFPVLGLNFSYNHFLIFSYLVWKVVSYIAGIFKLNFAGV
jgi:hypothetical protein